MKTIATLLLILSLQLPAFAGEAKKADLAGQWYPSSKERLSAMLDSYLDAAKLPDIEGDIRAVIVPHAGIVYSGPVAAYAYKLLGKQEISTVILLGFCHRKSFDGVSIYNSGSFETPLGPIEIDSKLANELISKDKKFVFYPDAFKDENSVELELPFIKRILPKAKMVPVAFGHSDYEYCRKLSEALSDILSARQDVVLIASADMSHYRLYDEAKSIDAATIELLKDFKAKEIYDKSVQGEQLFCGYMPVATTILAAEKAGVGKVKILNYATSGDVTGQKGKVVGYVSAAFAAIDDKKGDSMLDDAQKKRLLVMARETIDTYLKTGKAPDVKDDDPVLNREMGAFVTLHKDGQLRGCIGNIIGRGPLYLTVRDMAIQSATGDPRFPAVTRDELGRIDIEISVLSELEKVEDPSVIEMGVHGVLIRRGFSSGVFLPQVATETGWSREEFMTNLCTHKAGLMPDAWKTGEADIYTFTAEVFGEKDE